MTTFGLLLKTYRQQALLTQEQLAERTGLSVRGISDLERGARTHPHADTVQRLIEALHLSMDDRRALIAASGSDGEKRLPTPAPPLLPLLTPLYGREQHIQEIVSALEQGCRFMTITGPGGVGKTRLAQEIMRVMGERFSDGGVFIDLSTVTSGELVLPTIARLLGVQEETPLFTQISTLLGTKHLLLVLDTFEHVVSAASLLPLLLTHAPRLHMLVTSRRRLDVSGEQEYPLEPLALPASPPAQPSQPSQSALLPLSAAETLLLAQTSSMHQQMDALSRQSVADLCRFLDGLPLALELAAAQLRVLTPSQLLIAMQHSSRFLVLTNPRQDAPTRHQTLQATLQWSWDALKEDERMLWQRVSLFVHHWSLIEAESICSDVGGRQIDVKTALEGLLAHSLVRRVSLEAFELLDTIRAFGSERLAGSGERADLQHHYATYVLACLQGTSGHPRWQEVQIEQCYPSLRALFTWPEMNAESSMRIAAALGPFWEASGRLYEGRSTLEHLLVFSTRQISEEVLASAYHALGLLTAAQGAYAVAQTALEKSQSYLSMTDSLWPQVQRSLGNVLFDRGDYAGAEHCLRACLAGLEQRGDLSALAIATANLGHVLAMQQKEGEVVALYTRTIAVQSGSSDQRGRALLLNNYGELLLQQAAYAQARIALQESLSLFRRLHMSWGIAIAQTNLAAVALAHHQFDEAYERFRESFLLQRTRGEQVNMVRSLEGLAYVAWQRGQNERALGMYATAAEIRHQTHSLPPRHEQELMSETLAALASGMSEAMFLTLWQPVSQQVLDEWITG